VARLGWLGPVIALVGVAGGGLGVWYMVHAKPHPGATIETFKVDEAGGELLVRAEDGGDRAFIEARQKGETKWQALVPHYEGKTGQPALAWSEKSVTVRVVRDGRSEIFALAMGDGQKLGGFKLAPNHGPIAQVADGPLTLTDHVRSYEIVYGADWHQLVGIDLASGRGLWRTELGPGPIKGAGISGGTVWVDTGSRHRQFQVFNGEEFYKYGEIKPAE